MSIENKIKQILAESKAEANKDETVVEATDINDPSDGGEMNPANDKNRKGKQEIGGKGEASNVVTKDAEDGDQTALNDINTDGVTKVAGDNPDNKKGINEASVKNVMGKFQVIQDGKVIGEYNAKYEAEEHAQGLNDTPKKSKDKKGIKEDIAALVDGEDLTEEFKEKAATIFEAAVLYRVKDEVAKLDEAYAVKLDEEKELFKEELVEKIDGYLDYVVEQWLAQNEIALESGMKSDILESFVSGMKNLFEEHYIDVPEEKYDVLGDLQEQINSLTTKLDETVASNVELRTSLLENEAEKLVGLHCEGLVETDKEKFLALVEELEFDGIESFDKKLKTIRESYFTKKSAKPLTESFMTDEPVIVEDAPAKSTITDPSMRGYVATLDKLK